RRQHPRGGFGGGSCRRKAEPAEGRRVVTAHFQLDDKRRAGGQGLREADDGGLVFAGAAFDRPTGELVLVDREAGFADGRRCLGQGDLFAIGPDRQVVEEEVAGGAFVI